MRGKKTPGGPKQGDTRIAYHASRAGDANQSDHHKRSGVRCLTEQDGDYDIGSGSSAEPRTSSGNKLG